MPVLDRLAVAVTAIDTQILLLIVLFVAIVMAVIGVGGLFARRDPVERRLAFGASEAAVAGSQGMSVRQLNYQRKASKLEDYVTPKDESERSRVRLRFARAGYRRASAIRTYYVLRAGLGFGLSLTIALLAPLLSRALAIESIIVLTLLFGLAGFYLPTLWVARRIRRRQREIQEAFPDALDMLLVCVEAGHGLDAALNRVAEEVGPAHPVLGEELTIVGLELRAGKGRGEVLRDLARRVGVDEVSAFVTVLIQSDQFGTSIGDALRVYASEMRAKRMLRAEEMANKLPVKLALATIACTIPPVLLILAGPSLVMAMRTLSKLVE